MLIGVWVFSKGIWATMMENLQRSVGISVSVRDRSIGALRDSSGCGGSICGRWASGRLWWTSWSLTGLWYVNFWNLDFWYLEINRDINARTP